ncbi:MAG: phosphatase PAP2 family protein [Rhodanobacteraceae bacterium]|nr:phosphatase PAP2 family protein [Rhodanobacteraceae bacterium]
MNGIERWNRLEVRSGEWRLCLAANRWGARRDIARFFGLVSRAGDGVFWYSLMGALLLLGGARGAQAALHMASVGLIALALYRRLKRHTRRPRPFRAHRGIVAHTPPLDEYSFPSGHTLHAVSFSLVAIAYFPLLAVALLPFTALVAASRVVLGLHFPSDVLAAGVIGSLLAGLSLWLVPGVTLALI